MLHIYKSNDSRQWNIVYGELIISFLLDTNNVAYFHQMSIQSIKIALWFLVQYNT